MVKAPILYMTVGLPGSGKSTFFQKMRNEKIPDVLYFSADDMREWIQNGPYQLLDPTKEESVLHRYELLVLTAMKAGHDLILDRTHLTIKKRAKYIEQARLYGYKIKIYYFKRSLQICILQNKQRAKRCPEAHIRKCYAMLEEPTLDEADGLMILWDDLPNKMYEGMF